MADKNNNKQNKDIAPTKLKLLVTVVRRNKAEFFADYIESFGVNYQTITNGLGTSKMLNHEIMTETTEKAVIFSLVRDDIAQDILNGLEEKFATKKKGGGISFTVPLTSVIGVLVYKYLTNIRGDNNGF